MDSICNKCGYKIKSDSLFCDNCGNRINTGNKFYNDNYNYNDNVNVNVNDNETNEEKPNYSQQNADINVESNLTFNLALKNWLAAKFEGRCSNKECLFTILCLLPPWFLVVYTLSVFHFSYNPLIFPFNHIYRALIKCNIINYNISPHYYMGIIIIILFLLTVKPQVSFYTRRLHDLNMSGFWQILLWLPNIFTFIFPFVAIFPFGFKLIITINYVIYYTALLFGLYLAFTPGTQGKNKYGLPSKY